MNKTKRQLLSTEKLFFLFYFVIEIYENIFIFYRRFGKITINCSRSLQKLVVLFSN